MGDKPLQFLGVWTTRSKQGEIKDDMTEYIRQIKVQELKGTGPLDQKGVTLFRQLTMPHLLYEVSSLAQRVTKAMHEDLQGVPQAHPEVHRRS